MSASRHCFYYLSMTYRWYLQVVLNCNFFNFCEDPELSGSPVLNFACVVQKQLSVHSFIGVDNLNMCICKDFAFYFAMGLLVWVEIFFCCSFFF